MNTCYANQCNLLAARLPRTKLFRPKQTVIYCMFIAFLFNLLPSVHLPTPFRMVTLPSTVSAKSFSIYDT